MPSHLDTGGRVDDLLAASWRLIDEGGIRAVTVRRPAAGTGSPGDPAAQLTNRERVLRLLALRTGDHRLATVGGRVPWEGITAFLPRDEDELVVLRAWLAWVELSRADRSLGESVGSIREHERGLVRRALHGPGDGPADPLLVETVHALVCGIQELTTRRPGGLGLDHARGLLETAVDQLVAASAAARSSATIRSGSSAE